METSYDLSNGIPEKNDGNIKFINYDIKMPLTEELKYFIKHLNGMPIKTANVDSAIDIVKILTVASKSLELDLYEATA